MKLTINTKTVIVLIFQLAFILGFVSFAALYVQKLATSSENIVKDNLRSVRYCAIMQQALHELRNDINQLSPRTEFENTLLAELNNITEIGEKELADKIQSHYFQWLKTPEDNIYSQLVSEINEINEMNIAAIERKNTIAQEVASHATIYIIIIGGLGAVVAFLVTFGFIGYLTNSVKEVDIAVELKKKLFRRERLQ